ncbi:MAG: enoyl-CoA hydratase-related protein [Dehalococcoidia bacterium]
MSALRVEREGGVGVITFARPERYNTITDELRWELSAAIDELDEDHEVHVILLRAEGKGLLRRL